MERKETAALTDRSNQRAVEFNRQDRWVCGIQIPVFTSTCASGCIC